MASILNSATIFGVRDGDEVYANSNEVEIEVAAPADDISVTKTASDDLFEAGEIVTYTVVVCNNGTTLNDFTFEDILAPGLDYVENSFTVDGSPFGATYNAETKELESVIGTLGADECRTISFQATTSIPS